MRVSGNKNAAIHAMAATLLTSDDCYLENVPVIGDVRFMVEILRSLGATVEYTSPSSLRVNAAGVHTLAAPSELATHLRGSFLVMGPLLTRFGEAACCPPGGDIIGLRPLNVHLAGFRVLNATVSHEGDKFVARTKGLRGSRIFLDYPSVLGTQNLILAATLAEGRTTLVNAAAEPEIESLVEMLTQMGARISGAGRHTIEIEGVARAGRRQASHHPRPHRSRDLRHRRRHHAGRRRNRGRRPAAARRPYLEAERGGRGRRGDGWSAPRQRRVTRCGR